MQGTGDLIVTNGFKWYGGSIDVPNLRLSGSRYVQEYPRQSVYTSYHSYDLIVSYCSAISVGEAGFTSESAGQILAGSTQLLNNGTLIFSTISFGMPAASAIINLPGATMTVSSSTSPVIGSAVSKTLANSWSYQRDPRPANYPVWDNQGTLNLQATARPAYPNDELWVSADFRSSGTVNVAASNILGFYRPFASATSSTSAPTIRDVWGGAWVVNGPISFVGNAISLSSSFVATSTLPGGVIRVGYLDDCTWIPSSDFADGISTSIEAASGPITINAPVVLYGCTYVRGSNRFTFQNVTIYDAILQAPIVAAGNMSVRTVGAFDKNKILIESSLTISGYATFERTTSRYDDYMLRMGPSASIIVSSSGTIDVTWIEISWASVDNKGTASIAVNGNAIFRRNQYVYDWYVPTTFAASSVSRFTGPTVSSWSDSNGVVNFQTSSVTAGHIDVRDRYYPVFADKWNILSTATWAGPTSGSVSWIEHFARPSSASPNAADRTLSVPNGMVLYSLLLYGNENIFSVPAGGYVYVQNHWLNVAAQTYCCANSVYHFTNYSALTNLGSAKLEGAVWVNEGYMFWDMDITENPNIATRGRFFNAWNGRVYATSSGSTSETIQLINYGDVSWGGSQTAGVLSNSTMTIRSSTIFEDAFVLLPTSTLTYLINSPTSAPYVQFNGGFWCHVQGKLQVTFDTNPSGAAWTPTTGQSWAIISTSSSEECIGQYSQVTVSGLPAGLSVKATWHKDSATFTGMKITLCSTSESGCGTAAAQTKTDILFKAAYLALIPPGSYTPPAGTIYATAPGSAPTDSGSQAPGGGSAAARLNLNESIFIALFAFAALIFVLF